MPAPPRSETLTTPPMQALNSSSGRTTGGFLPWFIAAFSLLWGPRFCVHSHLNLKWIVCVYQFSSVHSLSQVRFFATPWTAAYQASLSIANSWSLLKFMSIKSVMPSNHLILCHPLCVFIKLYYIYILNIQNCLWLWVCLLGSEVTLCSGSLSIWGQRRVHGIRQLHQRNIREWMFCQDFSFQPRHKA